MAATLQTVQTVSPNSIGIVHHAKISDMAKFLCCCTTCNMCCWGSKIKARTYVQVHENRIEANYPMLPICGCGLCCLQDCVRVRYFDRITSTIKPANICTPFHLCGLIPCCGQVAAVTPFECCNNDMCRFCCPCCHCSHYIPGLESAHEFGEYATKARAAFLGGQRMLSAPPPQQHMGETQMT